MHPVSSYMFVALTNPFFKNLVWGHFNITPSSESIRKPKICTEYQHVRKYYMFSYYCLSAMRLDLNIWRHFKRKQLHIVNK